MSGVPIFGNLSAVPPRVGKLWFTDHRSFAAPNMGMGFTYRTMYVGANIDPGKEELRDYVVRHTSDPAPGFLNIIATNCLYAAGDDPLPKDMASPKMRALFLEAIDEMAESGARAGQTDVLMLESDTLSLPGDNENVQWLWAAFRFRNPDQEDNTVAALVSHLAVRVDAGHINHVRFTYPETLDADVGYRNFIRFLYEWRISICRVAAEDAAIGPFEVPEQEDWGQVLTDLLAVRAPEKLLRN